MLDKTLHCKVSLVLLFFSQFSYATVIYQWKDAQGRQHYADQHYPQATQLKLVEELNFYRVNKVYDGDTVLLSDGRKIRLLGINTPEITHPRQLPQRGGEEARQWLTRKLLNTRIRLEYDVETLDKYKRHLAHIFTEQGMHINVELVRLGYASTSIYPPNLKYLEQLLVAEQHAEFNTLGLWQYVEYQPKYISELNPTNKRGWQRIIGRVRTIKSTPKNNYLQLTDNFVLRIKKTHIKYFNDLKLLIGKQVEVRGWVNKDKRGFSMLIKHPSAIKNIE